MQPQGQVQILINLIDRGMNLQEAIDAPRVRALGGSRISVEQTLTADVITRLASLGMISFPERKFPATGSSPTTLRAVSKEALKLSPSTRNSTPSAVLPIRGSMAWPLGTKNANKRAICFRVYSRSTHCSRCARRWLPFAWEQTANAFGTSFSGMRWPYFAGPGVFGVLNQFAKSAEYRNPRNPANLGPFLYLSSLPRFRLFHWARSYG